MSKIIVYSKPNCPQCVLTKNYLTNREIEFEERDISTNDAWRDNLLEMGYMQLPVVVKEFPKDSAHGRVRDSITGFNVPALDKLLESFE
jgi:glutaredoxin